MPSLPFAAIPLAAIHDDRLSAGAIRVYGELLDHGRRKGYCWPSQARIAERARCSERSVRTYLRQLEAAGYITTTRRGRELTNLYVITTSERQKQPTEPLVLSENSRGDSFDSASSTFRFDSLEDHPTLADDHEQDIAPPAAPPLPASVARLASDVSAEMRDAAPRSTQTRVARLFARSVMSEQEFVAAVYAARSITRQRFSRIRKRNRSGQCLPAAYWLAVLQNAVIPPDHGPEGTEPRVVRQSKGRKADRGNNSPSEPSSSLLPLLRPPPELPDHSEFWQAIAAATNGTITDLRGYCRAASRPPPGYGNPTYALAILHDAMRRT